MIPVIKINVPMAYTYPDLLYKVKEGDQMVTYRKAGAPTRLARETDYDFWYEEIALDALAKMVEDSKRG